MSLHIFGFVVALLSAGPSSSCVAPPADTRRPLERLSNENETAFSARISAFNAAYYNRQAEERAAEGANARVRDGIEEGRRQDAQWDATADILLAHVVSVEPEGESGLYRFGFQTDRVLKGRSSITMTYRIGSRSTPIPCTDVLTGTPDSQLGTPVIVFLPNRQANAIDISQLVPLSALRSDRLWAIINGTASTP